MKHKTEHKTVPLKLNAKNNEGDAALVDELVAKMVADGWAFVSLASPTAQTALVVFSRRVAGDSTQP